jgi:class 3 adenylate cyclase/tetratricopeptide (TPR) repeat protein
MQAAAMAACASCGAENAEGQRYCGSCGAPLAAEEERQRQRKTVTVVFCDVVGSTALGESRDPEALERMLATYFRRMKEIVESHGGTVEKFIGDAVVAVFGVPVAHEDDALRALRAAVEMRDALPQLGIEGRIGVNTGEIVTSGHGTIVTGDAVNVAARLEQAAAAGEVLVGPETLALAGVAAAVEKLEPLVLKGKSEPVAAFRLLRVGQASNRRRGDEFVGRRDELSLLRGAWKRALGERRCELVTIVGEPGVGKSRLVEELVAGLQAHVVRGHCLSYGEGITYFPVVEVIKQLNTQPRDAAASRALGSLLGESDVPTSADEIAWAFRKLVEQAAPLLVVFDDIQWGEETFLDLVEHVALLSTTAPLLLLCIARPELSERRPQWPVALRLGPLPPEDVEALLPGNLSDSLREQIARAAAGNPLFLTEMAAVAAEAGDQVIVPPTLKALLAARLDRLERAERGVLQRGAVEGELFHRGAVQALEPTETELTPRLTALVRKDLIRADRPLFPADDGFRFCHLLIRDAAYDALPKATRAALHERFADWLDRQGADLIERDEIVGYHLEQAYRYTIELGSHDAAAQALADRAARRLLAASNTARGRGDYRAGAHLLTRAAELAADRVSLLPDLGELFFELGEFEQARTVLDEALATGDDGTVALAALWRAIVAGHSGERGATLTEIIARSGDATAVFERIGDQGRLATVIAIHGHHRYFVGQAQQAIELLGRARELALRSNDRHRARRSLIVMLAAMARGPTPVREVESLIDRIEREAWPELVPLTVMRLRRYRGLMHGFSGRIEDARRDFEEARHLANDLGVTFVEASMGTSLGQTELIAGRPDLAERELRREYLRLGDQGETAYRSSVASLLAAVMLAQGRSDEALELAEVSLALAEPDDVDPQVRARGVIAQVLARRGIHADAERLAGEASELATKTDFPILRGDALLALAEVFRAVGERARMVDALRAALELFERKENIAQAEQTRARLAAASAPLQPSDAP